MEAIVFVTAGELKSRRFPLAPGHRLVVGRSRPWSDIELPDQGVARRHATLENRDDGLHVVDISGGVGTVVNGRRLANGAERQLSSGDRIQLGGAELQVLKVAVATHASSKFDDAPVQESAPEESSVGTIRRRFSEVAALGPAIANVANLQRLQEQLEAIYRLGNNLHTERRLESILNIAADTALAVSYGERSAILMLDEDSGEPVEVVARSRTTEEAPGSFPTSLTVVEESIRQGMSLLIGDAMSDTRFLDGVASDVRGIKSVMCVPLRSEQSIRGAIYVDHCSDGQIFDETDLQLLTAVGQQVGHAIDRARLIGDLEDLFIGSIHTLVAAIEAKDRYTRGHSERVTSYALAVAGVLGLDNDERTKLEVSGLLHDIGKIGVPELVLNKPAALNGQEFATIREHPVLGARIIQNIANIDRVVDMRGIVEAVLHHHERYDGRGYPNRIAGEQIPLASRILAVADTYDAVTTKRSYRSARPLETAARIIWDNSGSQFDPRCVQAFMMAFQSGSLDHAAHTVQRLLSRRPRRLPTDKSGGGG